MVNPDFRFRIGELKSSYYSAAFNFTQCKNEVNQYYVREVCQSRTPSSFKLRTTSVGDVGVHVA